MDCREAEELLPAYALNALSPDEITLVEAHLDRCPWCKTLLREQVQVAAALAQVAEPFELPQKLRASTLKAAKEQVRHRRAPRGQLHTSGRLVMGVAASVAILLLAAVTAITVRTSGQINDLKEENADMMAHVSELSGKDQKLVDMLMEQRSLNYILASDDKQVLSLQGSESVPQAQGVLMIAVRSGSAILMANGLEPSSGDQAYHVWLKKDDYRATVGRLSVDETGWGVLTMWPEQPITFFQHVWVTKDDAPTGSTVLWGSIAPQ